MAPTTPRGRWTAEQLRKALKGLKTGKLSQRKASELYGIPRRTLRNHLKSGSSEKVTGRSTTLTKSQETDLSERIIRLAQVGLPLTPKLVRKQAYEFCKSNKPLQAPGTEFEDMHVTPIPSPMLRNDSSDSDATFYVATEPVEEAIQETHQDVSPSIFRSAVHKNSAHDMSEKKITNIATSMRQLVDYSSSSESGLPNNDTHQDQLLCVPTDRHLEFQSPVPTTSGLNIRRGISRYNSSTSSDLSHDEMLNVNILPNPYKKFHIYSSESESDQENIDPQVTTSLLTNKEKDKADDSDDNIPISKLKGRGKRSTGLFKEHIPTPNFATIKSKPRRKAINYIGQKITKDLFEKTKNKTKDTKTKKGKTPQTKQRQQGKLPNIKQELRSNKGKKNKDIKEKRTDAANKETWYCQACEEERIADMRQCKVCGVWFHEECVGLTKKDTEMFVCPGCDRK